MPTPWNKGKTGVYSQKTKRKMSRSHLKNPTRYWLGKKRPEISGDKHPRPMLGKTAWNKGIPWSEEAKKKMRKAHKGKHYSPKTEFKKGLIPWCAGKKLPELSKARMGEGNPMWNGGLSFLPYGPKFNKYLKKKIKKRDRFSCRVCNRKQKELRCNLEIHHIDYDKRNNSEDNLIALCKGCHSATNKDRDKWITWFTVFTQLQATSSLLP